MAWSLSQGSITALYRCANSTADLVVSTQRNRPVIKTSVALPTCRIALWAASSTADPDGPSLSSRLETCDRLAIRLEHETSGVSSHRSEQNEQISGRRLGSFIETTDQMLEVLEHFLGHRFGTDRGLSTRYQVRSAMSLSQHFANRHFDAIGFVVQVQ